MIKRSFIISIILILLCFITTAAATPLKTQTMVTSKTVLAYSTPLTKSFKNSKIIKEGETVALIRTQGNWSAILLNDDVYYLWTAYLEEEVINEPNSVLSKKIYSPSYFRNAGVIYWSNWKWTYYSQKALPGKGLRIPGRHLNEDGYVVDSDGRICLASTSLSKGCIVDTPFGAQGKVYDSGCAKGILDVYVGW